MQEGLVHIYTGAGKGKTTAAVGLGSRASGQGLKVLMIQFLKGRATGEMESIARLAPNFQLFRFNEHDKFTWEMKSNELGGIKGETRIALNYTIEAMFSGKWDLIILDEVIPAINLRFLSLKEVVEIVKEKPLRLELVLTGRDAPLELIELADYVSEITARKHPMQKGIMARQGIEY